MGLFDFDDGRDSKRSLTPRERQFLYEQAKGRCENPKCSHPKITFFEMQVGHRKAWANGGRTSLKNSVCLCYKCNHDQGTDSWEIFMKKLGCQTKEMKAKQAKSELRDSLASMTLPQLKLLAANHKVKVSGYVEETLFASRRVAPTKEDYVRKLSSVISNSDFKSRGEA